MMEEIKILEDVALLVDKPEHELRRGDVGTVVEVGWSEVYQRREYDVEFVDENTGEFIANILITDPAEIMALHFKRPRT
jgi:hypothetical protein